MHREIDDLLNFLHYFSCFLHFVSFDTDGVAAARSHVNCHAVPFNLFLKLKDGLPSYLSGRREDVDVELVDFNGLMSFLILPHILGNVQGKVLGDTIKNAHHENSSTSEIPNSKDKGARKTNLKQSGKRPASEFHRIRGMCLHRSKSTHHKFLNRDKQSC